MADNLNAVTGKTFFSSDDEGKDKQTIARELVVAYHEEHVFHNQDDQVTFDDTYVVLFTYVLGNWKALVSTTRPDGRYYEVTYNAAKGETYIDEYQKQNNVCIKDA